MSVVNQQTLGYVEKRYFIGLCQQLDFVPKSGVGRGTGAFIYTLSADETSSALAAPRHAITALFSCRFKCPCPPRRQRHFHGNTDRAYNTLHFASKVVCQKGLCPLWIPPQEKTICVPSMGLHIAFSCYPALRLYRLSKSQRGFWCSIFN